MALTDKLKAIADAIRGKTGKTEGMTLDEMPEEIAGIETGGGGAGVTIPSATLTKVTIGENTVSNAAEACNYFGAVSSAVYLILLDTIPTDNNQVVAAGFSGGGASFIRHNAGAYAIKSWNNTVYDAKLVPGTTYSVYQW